MSPPRFSLFGSYVVRAAAEACGVDYTLALQWVDADSYGLAREIRDDIRVQAGSRAFDTFHGMITRRFDEGGVRVRRWSPQTGGWRR